MKAKEKRGNLPRQKPSENYGLGIPDVLKRLRYEKQSEVVPVKVEFSLKRCLKQIAEHEHTSVSAWVRQAVLEKLENTARKGDQSESVH